MPFREELQQLSLLLRLAAETILQISDARAGDRVPLDSVALEVDVLADRLMTIGALDREHGREQPGC